MYIFLKRHRALLNQFLVPTPLSATDMLRLRSPVDPEENFFAGLHDDMQMEIFNYLDFDDLVSVSHTCRNFRMQIRTMINNRLSSALHAFLGSSTESVMNMLQFGGGCVAGQFITAIFNSRLPVRSFPKQLTCFVTRRGRRVLLAYIIDELRFGQPEIASLEEPFRNVAFGAYTWNLPVSGFCFCEHVLIKWPV